MSGVDVLRVLCKTFTIAIITLVGLLGIFFSPAWATGKCYLGQPGELCQVIVRYKESHQSQTLIEKHERRLALVHKGRSGSLLLSIADSSDVDRVLDELRRDPGVLFAERNQIRKAAAESVDPFFNKQWHLPVTQTPAAWSLMPRDTPTVVVAVLDTGIDASHPDFTGRVAPGGYDFINDDHIAHDDHGHGTKVSGVIAAAYNNAVGVVGVVGPAAVQILPVKVLDSQGIGNDFGIAEGIRYAVDNGAQVINLSLGAFSSSCTNELRQAINYAGDNGVIVVAAAGNDGKQSVNSSAKKGNGWAFYPASLSGVLAVTATNRENFLTSFSNYGTGVSLAAPGEIIYTTDLYGGYNYANGTSFAAPIVSAVAALLMAKRPDYNSQKIIDSLLQYAVDLGEPGYDIKYGHGMINSYNVIVQAGGGLSGSVRLLHASNSGNATVTVDGMYNTAITENDGGFYLSGIIPGSRNISLHAQGFLAVGVPGITIRDGQLTELELLELIPGDVNGDGNIDLNDLTLAAKAYGTVSGVNNPADLDRNGLVDLFDLVMLSKHLGYK